MMVLTNILLAVHVVSASLWVGAVFMGAIIDPPALRLSTNRESFLANFIVMQGTRVFPWIYTGMISIFATGMILVWLYPPQNALEIIFVTAKFLALAIMAGNTLYGTRVTWPKIQFATPEEVPMLWRPYLIRAYTTLGCGIFAFILGVVFR